MWVHIMWAAFVLAFVVAWVVANWDVVRRSGTAGCDALIMLTIVSYAIHQFEEHAIDVYGREYSFISATSHFFGCSVEVEWEQSGFPRLFKVVGDCVGKFDEFTVLWINNYCVISLFSMFLYM